MGAGLLLGPLVYALSLTGEPVEAPACVAEASAPEVEAPAELVVVHRCEQLEPTVPEPTPEPATPEPKPEPELTPEPDPTTAPFLFVTDAGMVLSSEAEHAWGEGRLFEPEGEISFRAAKRADATEIPAELWAQRGRSFDLYGPEGKLCTARLGELRVIAQYGWGLVGILGEDWYDRDPAEASPAEIREGLWQRDDLWLVAEIESEGSCEGALWARDASLPAPALLRRSSASNPISEARLAAFAASEELAKTERRYRATWAELSEKDPEYLEYAVDWDTVLRESPASAASWLDAEGEPRLVSLEFGLHSEGCGDPFDSRITALDQVRAGEFVDTGLGWGPVAVFDADLDGELELLYVDESSDGLSVRLESATLGDSLFVDHDWFCPC